MIVKKSVSDAFEFIRNGISVKQNSESSGVPITRIETIADKSIDPNRVGYADIDINNLGKFKNYLLKDGDILMSHINSPKHLGKTALYRQSPKSLIHGMNLLCLRTNIFFCDFTYANYYFQSTFFLQDISKISNKSVNQASFSVGRLKDLEIPLPPLKTQERIASILDDAAALRDKTAKLLEEYNLLAQSIFLEMFGDPLTNPMKWDEVLFNEVLVLRRGFDLPKRLRMKGEVPIIGSNGILDWHNEYKIKGPGIVTGRSGTLGKVHFIESNYWPLNTALYSQHLKDNNPIFLLFLLKNFRPERFSRGAGVPTLNRNLVHSEYVYRIPVYLQTQFAEKIALIEQQKDLAKQELQESEDLFNCLLQKAFKGGLD